MHGKKQNNLEGMATQRSEVLKPTVCSWLEKSLPSVQYSDLCTKQFITTTNDKCLSIIALNSAQMTNTHYYGSVNHFHTNLVSTQQLIKRRQKGGTVRQSNNVILVTHIGIYCA